MKSDNRKIMLKYPQIVMKISTNNQHFINFKSMKTNIFILIACTLSSLAFSQTRTTITINSRKIEQINAIEAHKIGDTKNDIQSTDHNGWYLMNGRAITDLPLPLQKKASILGFKEHLSDAENVSLPKNTQPLNTDRSGSVSGKSTSESSAVVLEVTSNRFIYLGV